MLGSLVAAGAASLAVSPVVTIIDRAIVVDAAGTQAFWPSVRSQGVRLLRNPLGTTLRSPGFRLILGAYFATYATANYFSSVPLTSTVNMGAIALKDARFSRMYGVAPPHRVPLVCFALFLARDSLTVASAFALPERLEPHLGAAAHLVPVCVVQVLTTPVHLLALDLYNHPLRLAADRTVRQRARFIWTHFAKACIGRVARVLPAFGVGGVINQKVLHAFQ